MNDVELFMAAIRKVESGGKADPYRAQGFSYSEKYGRAQGAYQIMSNLVGSYAAQAGYAGLTVQQFLNSPQTQDAIARYHFNRLYNKYGSWDLVAAAWFGGEGTANDIRDHGWNHSSARRSDGGNDVIQYVDKMRAALGQVERGYNPEAAANMPAGRYMPQGMSEQQLQEAGYTGAPWEREEDVAPEVWRVPESRALAQSMFDEVSQRLTGVPEDESEEEAEARADRMREAVSNIFFRNEPTFSESRTARASGGTLGTNPMPDVQWPQGGGGAV